MRPLTAILLAVAVCAALAGCTRSTVLESRGANRSTTTTAGIQPVPNGGDQLPDATSSTLGSSSTAPSAATTATTGAPATTASPVSVKSASTKRSTASPTTKPASAAKTVASTPTTTAPPTTTTAAPTGTTTTLLPDNPVTIDPTVSPTVAFPGSQQVFQYALTDPSSGPTPTLSSCTGVDYLLTSTGYVAAAFQTLLDCNTVGAITRTLPGDALPGIYDLCVTISGQPPSTVCTPYYVINYPTSGAPPR